MTKRTTFRIKHFDFPLHICFYCGKKPAGILTIIKTEEEIRTCEKCAYNKGRVKK